MFSGNKGSSWSDRCAGSGASEAGAAVLPPSVMLSRASLWYWLLLKMSRIKVYYILIGLAALFYRVSCKMKGMKWAEGGGGGEGRGLLGRIFLDRYRVLLKRQNSSEVMWEGVQDIRWWFILKICLIVIDTLLNCIGWKYISKFVTLRFSQRANCCIFVICVQIKHLCYRENATMNKFVLNPNPVLYFYRQTITSRFMWRAV